MTPVAWMLRETTVGTDSLTAENSRPICGEIFIREEVAHAAAKRKSNRWRSVTAFPVYAEPLPTSAPKPSWTCFFCDEVFTDRAAAAQHFGVSEEQTPACRIAGADGGLVRVLRETEDALYQATAALHDESADTIRAWRGMLSRHATALRLAEEIGYEKGLADGRLVQQERGSNDESTEGQSDRRVGDYDGGSAGGLGGNTGPAAGIAGSAA